MSHLLTKNINFIIESGLFKEKRSNKNQNEIIKLQKICHEF